MLFKNFGGKWFFLNLVLLAPVPALISGPNELVSSSVRTNSIPRLLRIIKFGDYGSRHIRLGDLNADGAIDLLLVQADPVTAYITCLTAIELNGRVLWQVGKPNSQNKYYKGENVQIYDLDRDGQNDVIYNSDQKNSVTMLNGKTGVLEKKVSLGSKHDTILFVDFAGRGYPQEVFLADAFSKGFSVYDKEFQLLFSKEVSPIGHYPINHDFDGDGKDELFCGYVLYDHNGRELWSHHEFPEHNDSTYISDMDDDGHAEIAVATSADAVLLDESGKILFREQMTHCQHALIGKFRQDLPGKQAVFVSRERQRMGTPFALAKLYMFTKSGRLLWAKEDEDNLSVTAALVVDNWTGNPSENFIALEERGFSAPVLLDGSGRQVAEFPFPPALLEKGDGRFIPAEVSSGPGGRRLYDEYHLDHVDCYGDEREEILVYNEKALYLYTNAALWQKPRLYNHNYFPGRR